MVSANSLTSGIKVPKKPDLADHFIACSSLGRYLTVFDESRFVITDDFMEEGPVDRTAAAVASIFSNDPLVAEAALLPLSKAAQKKTSGKRENYEEFFVQDGTVEYFNNNLVVLSTSAINVKNISQDFLENLKSVNQNKLEEKDITEQEKYIINHTLDAIKEIRI